MLKCGVHGQDLDTGLGPLPGCNSPGWLRRIAAGARGIPGAKGRETTSHFWPPARSAVTSPAEPNQARTAPAPAPAQPALLPPSRACKRTSPSASCRSNPRPRPPRPPSSEPLCSSDSLVTRHEQLLVTDSPVFRLVVLPSTCAVSPRQGRPGVHELTMTATMTDDPLVCQSCMCHRAAMRALRGPAVKARQAPHCWDARLTPCAAARLHVRRYRDMIVIRRQPFPVLGS